MSAETVARTLFGAAVGLALMVLAIHPGTGEAARAIAPVLWMAWCVIAHRFAAPRFLRAVGSRRPPRRGHR